MSRLDTPVSALPLSPETPLGLSDSHAARSTRVSQSRAAVIVLSASEHRLAPSAASRALPVSCAASLTLRCLALVDRTWLVNVKKLRRGRSCANSQAVSRVLRSGHRTTSWTAFARPVHLFSAAAARGRLLHCSIAVACRVMGLVMRCVCGSSALLRAAPSVIRPSLPLVRLCSMRNCMCDQL